MALDSLRGIFPVGMAGLLFLGCRSRGGKADKSADSEPTASASPSVSEGPAPSGVAPDAPSAAPDAPSVVSEEPAEEPRRCPREMVDIGGRFCVDRYEDGMVDDATGTRLSPYYPPEPRLAPHIHELWEVKRAEIGPQKARQMPLPPLPALEETDTFLPRAVSRKGVTPQGFMSGTIAAKACARAGKRLCTLQEWVTACRGEKGTRFPYGEDYRPGVCNVFRGSHPAALLHDDASMGHSDPRLDLVHAEDGAPLLRPTGATPECVSRWGDDAIYDMVGNLDEWIDDPEGTFVGGFFSRSTKNGCDASVHAHPFDYWDYSIGVRCCR